MPTSQLTSPSAGSHLSSVITMSSDFRAVRRSRALSTGSQRIGSMYGPIVATWLLYIGVTGAQSIAGYGPRSFDAWSPYYLRYFWTLGSFRGRASWRALGGVFLCVTGAEAMFADLGHFGHAAMCTAWLLLVFPALLLCYTGQAAWLLSFGDLTDPANPALCFTVAASAGGALAAQPGAEGGAGAGDHRRHRGRAADGGAGRPRCSAADRVL